MLPKSKEAFFRSVSHWARHRFFERAKREILRPFAWRNLDRKMSILSDTRSTTDGPVLVCLVKDGEDFIEEFLSHYRALGFSEFVFLDNGSGDQTCALLKKEPDVLLLQSHLSFKYFYHSMQTWLVRRFSNRRWTLLADIDEFFDFPRSEELEIGGLIQYLEEHRYEAVLAPMLDMYPKAITRDAEDLNWYKTHRYFETKSIEWGSYPAHVLGLVPDGVKIAKCGVRHRVFGVHELIAKSVFFDASKVLVTVADTHYAFNARVADVTGFIRHYRFKPPFFETMSKIAEGRQYYLGSQNYRKMDRQARQTDRIEFYDPEISCEFEGTASVLDANGCSASDAFLDFADRNDLKRNSA